MVEDRWGRKIHAEFGWACRDADLSATDSYVSIYLGAEFDPERRIVIFYEGNLPELRKFVALLARNMELQERGAQDHGRESDDGVDWLRSELTRLLDALPDSQPEQGDREQ